MNFNVNHCDFIDCFFTKTRQVLDPNIFYFQQATFDLTLEFLKNISKSNIKIKRNLSTEEIESVFKFIENKPFKEVELDKNVGVGIMKHKLYNSLCYELLSDNNNYLELKTDPLKD